MIDGNFKIDMLLGTGGSSKVYSCSDANQDLYAVKIIRKDRKFSQGLATALLDTEINVMQMMQDHPNILNGFHVNTNGVIDVHGEKHEIMYCIVELAKKGAIRTFVKRSGHFEEEIVRFYALQITNALAYIHSQGYAHMDVKVDNILLDENYNAKLADLGTSVQTNFGYTSSRCGTKQYIAPEILEGESDEQFNAYKADAYSLGVTLYVMLTGNFPSTAESTLHTGDYSYNPIESQKNKEGNCLLSNLSKDCRDFLSCLLNQDPMKRSSILEILEHPWISDSDSCIPAFEVYMEMKAREDFIVGSCSESS